MPNWETLLESYKENFLQDLTGLIAIPSVKDAASADESAPFGQPVKDALTYMMALGERDGFKTQIIDNVAGHLEVGQGQTIFGILSHLDVVPVQENDWQTAPFNLTQKNGWLYGRGVSDDKGPTLAAYYALKMILDAGLSLNQRIRLIYGTDEENDWDGVKVYFAKEAMPDFGFVPDAIFPLIYAEKGIISFDFHKTYSEQAPSSLIFESGQAYNVVPDWAQARLTGQTNLQNDFQAYLKRFNLEGSWQRQGQQQTLSLKGLAAHGAGPDKGINAALYLAHFLRTLPLDPSAKDYLDFIDSYFFADNKGEKLGIAYKDQELGEVTVNPAVFSFEKGQARIGVNLRYPQSVIFASLQEKLNQLAQQAGFEIREKSHLLPSYTALDDPRIQTLLNVYQMETGDTSPALAIGGSTYGRLLKNGVSFGPAFPWSIHTLHQPNEGIKLEELWQATIIYAQALYRLCTVEGTKIRAD
ncbi:dipeptidase [Streptococcus criceti]|uniref:Dipeptidase PepV n=1 Tax=Streptococcus criceti HS-6 TaxID=873449 RepID=G5JNH3_STRCG|nr:dipeptidase PepV [Streptococcus criceti]EHI73988.1 dipeptidase PepV [Streptococcus criceti HS-6]SUN43331.1 dipeptidase [Streptococcus criceti]